MEMVGIYMKDMESFLMMYFIVDQCYWKEPEDPMAIFLGEISPYLLIDGRPFDTSVYKKRKEQVPINKLTDKNIMQYIYPFISGYQKEFGSDTAFQNTLKHLKEVDEKMIKEAEIKTKEAYNKYHYDD